MNDLRGDIFAMIEHRIKEHHGMVKLNFHPTVDMKYVIYYDTSLNKLMYYSKTRAPEQLDVIRNLHFSDALLDEVLAL